MLRDLIIALQWHHMSINEFHVTGYSTFCNSLFRLTIITKNNHMSTSLAPSGWNPRITNGFLVQITFPCHVIIIISMIYQQQDWKYWYTFQTNFNGPGTCSIVTFLLAFHIWWKCFDVSLSHHPITRNLSTSHHSTNVLAWATCCNDSIMKQTRVK